MLTECRRSARREAEDCRNQALLFEGKPEKPFLLKVAAAFDQLETASRKVSSH